MKQQSDIANSVTADYIVTEVLSDTYDDAGILKEKCYRWLFRIWTRLNLSMIRSSRTVILPIAPGTKTMMLPPDYVDFIFLGYPGGGHALPIAVNRNLMPQLGIEENKTVCDTCGHVDLCSLDMQQIDEAVIMDGQEYTKTTTRIIQPDGSYIEEVTEPVKDYSKPVVNSTLTIPYQGHEFNTVIYPDIYVISFGGNPAEGDKLFISWTYDRSGLMITKDIVSVAKSGWSATNVQDDVYSLTVAATGAGSETTDASGNPAVGLAGDTTCTATTRIEKNNNVEMQTTKKVVCVLDTTSCPQCVPATPGNLQLLSGCGCTDALCSCCGTDMLPYDVKPSDMHYNLFEQEGFVQFHGNCLSKALLKYVTSGKCIGGVYYFPLATMETLIAGTYYKSIEKKKNVPQVEKDRARRAYTSERKELLRDFTKLSYQEWSELLDVIPRIPTT